MLNYYNKAISKPYEKRLYDSVRWRNVRANQLIRQPLCVMCQQQGRDTIATIVDHIIEHKGNAELFWDVNNHQSLCASCHSASKQMQEIHGYSQACDINGFPIDNRHPFNKKGE